MLIKGVELSKEAGLQTEVTKAVLVVIKEKIVLVHETEVSVAFNTFSIKEWRRIYLSQ